MHSPSGLSSPLDVTCSHACKSEIRTSLLDRPRRGDALAHRRGRSRFDLRAWRGTDEPRRGDGGKWREQIAALPLLRGQGRAGARGYRKAERVLDAPQPHLEALDSLPALKAWRDAFIRLNKAAQSRGCPLGSLASELANDSEPARKRLADSFSIWGDRIENGLARMQERGELGASADPHDLALALLSAVEGGLLLAKTTHSSRPLELSLDMAIDHVARYMTARTSVPTARVRQ